MPGLVHRLLATVVALVFAASGWAQSPTDLPRGAIVDNVVTADDASQSYALYLPSTYAPDRAWSLLLAFHAGARGRAMVEKYQAAAERYGYVVAGSNTSRNGAADVSAAAVRAMSRDVGRRFAIDAQRVYLTGMSGGARVAMSVALGPSDIAGVIASSAGFPDARPRKSTRFPIFATAGTEDFNYLEMTTLDRQLTSPHRLALFEGGHTLPPDEVAMDAVEWLELRAMQDGRRPKDAALVEALFEKRASRVAGATDAVEGFRLTEALVADFKGLRDTSGHEARAKTQAADAGIKKALSRERADLDAEARALEDALRIEAGLNDLETRATSFARLGAMLAAWSRSANDTTQTPERGRARRLLAALTVGARERVQDEEYRALVERYRITLRRLPTP